MSKISELSDGGAIQSGDTLIAVRSGGNVKVTYGGTTTANIDGGTIDGTVIGATTPAAGSFTTISASGEIAANGGVAFGDNDKATFGASDDLQIYHDGSNSYISDQGTGDLNVLANKFLVKSASGGSTLIQADPTATNVQLFFGNAAKLATTSTGIDVTGTVTADGGLIGDAVSGSLSQTGMLTVSDTNSANTWTNFTGTAAYLPFSHELAVVNLADATTNSFAGLYFMAGESSAASGISSARIGAVRTGASTADLAFSTRGGSDMNQAMRIAGNGDISFYEDTGTTAKFFWDSSVEGIAIGEQANTDCAAVFSRTATINPTIRIGTLAAASYGYDAYMRFQGRSEGGTSYYGDIVFDPDARVMKLTANHNTPDTVVIDGATGNVGIGTASPTGVQGGNVLEVSNATGSEVIVFRDDGSAANGDFCGGFVIGNRDASGTPNHYAGMWADTDSFGQMTLQFAGGRDKYESGTADMVIDVSGNVGIGTTSPTEKLTLNASADYKLSLKHPSDGSYAALGAINNNFLLYNNGSERMRIDSSGDLRVGTTTSVITSAERAAFVGSSGISVQSTGGASSHAGAFWNNASSGDNLLLSFYTDGGALRGSIDYNRAGGLTRYNITSDYRAKDILGPVENAGATIDALKVYEGVMKGATQSRPMLIAHEAQEQAPYAVSGTKDAVNEDGTPDYQKIDHSSLVPLLIAEIQSLRARVAQLEGVN